MFESESTFIRPLVPEVALPKMPDQDRKPCSFLSEDPGVGVRCPICPGLIGVSFQADCVCCGRRVAAATTQPDSKADDLTKSVKALSIKTEVAPRVYSSSQYLTRSVAQESQHPAACPKTPRGRQIRRRNSPLLRSYSSLDQRPGGGTGDGVGSTQGGGSRSAAMRMYQQPQYVVRPLAPRRGPGRPTRGSAGGAHHVFKGVRTRRGVKGYLVEIRPPKWKRTIWLGTYNTSIEAAGAYDAGVFYTKKPNTKYNFQSSEGAFPPLPSHLHLDGVDSMEEIKLFVQNQARQAARRIGNAAMGSSTAASSSTDANSLHEPASSESCITGDSAALSVDGDDDLPSTSSSEQRVDSEFQNIPMDLDYLGQCLHAETAEETAKNMFLDYSNYKALLLEEEDHQLS